MGDETGMVRMKTTIEGTERKAVQLCPGGFERGVVHGWTRCQGEAKYKEVWGHRYDNSCEDEDLLGTG